MKLVYGFNGLSNLINFVIDIDFQVRYANFELLSFYFEITW